MEEQIISTEIISGPDLSTFGLINSADFVGKSVIYGLILLSIYSWAVIFSKLYTYFILKRSIKKFEKLFWSGRSIDELYEKFRKDSSNPLASIFTAAIVELKKSSKENRKDSMIKISVKDRISQAMLLIKNREIESIESNLQFLASLGSYAPFVGLFGTVWGIMHSFQSIAASKNTSIAVVAPGIAEALLATAIGLIAAIPAVAFYNYLMSSANFFYNKMEDFSGELYTIISRNIDEEKL